MNDILKIMYEKLNREEKRKKILFINWRKSRVKALGIKHSYNIAICQNKKEKEKLENNIAAYKEFDKITIFDLNKTEIINIVMKFDCCIMNPPYDGELHLKILAAICPNIEKTINISPIRWLQDPFAMDKISQLKRYTNTVCKHIISIDTVNAEIANKQFNIINYGDLGIYVLTNKSVDSFDYLNFWKIGKSNNEISILDKVCNSAVKKLKDKLDKNKKDGIRVLIALIAGNRGSCPIYKDLSYVIDGEKDNKDWTELKNMGGYPKPKGSPLPDSIKFNTINEANNFYDSYKTEFLKYICKISVQQQHIQPQKLPFMHSYQHPWTNKRFCNYFKITGYIDDNHAEPNSEWETILTNQ